MIGMPISSRRVITDFGMELDRGDRQFPVLDRHHHPVRGLGGDQERRRQSAAAGMQGMVAADGELGRQALQQPSA